MPLHAQFDAHCVELCCVLLQAEISCMVLQFVSEDITQFEDRGGTNLCFACQCPDSSADK